MTTPEVQTIRAVVRAIDGSEALVEVEEGGCGRCHEKGGCGGQNLSRALCGGPRSFWVTNGIGALVGEQVTVSIGAGAIRHGANVAYVIPLLAALGGAGTGMLLGGEGAAIAGMMAGLVLGFFHLRKKTGRGSGFSAAIPHLTSRSS